MMPYRNDPLLEDLKSQNEITTYLSEVYGKRRPFSEPVFSDFSLTSTGYHASLCEHQKRKDTENNTGCFVAVVCGVLGLIIAGEGSFIGSLFFAALGALIGIVIVSEINDSKRPSASWINTNKYDRAQEEYKKAVEIRHELIRSRKATEKWKLEYERKQKLRLQQQKDKDYWLSLTPFEFEEEVALRLKESGTVDSARVTKKSGDDGVDIWAEKNGHSIIIQCKAYTAPVGIKDARELLGVKIHKKIARAIFVSRSTFTNSVRFFAQTNGIELIDIEDLVRLAENLLSPTSLPLSPPSKKNPENKETPLLVKNYMAITKSDAQGRLLAVHETEYCHIHSQVKLKNKSSRRPGSQRSKNDLPALSRNVNLGSGVIMSFVSIPQGSFYMGTNNGGKKENTFRLVTISMPFWMSKTVVTNRQFARFLEMTNNTSGTDLGDRDCPLRRDGNSFKLSESVFGSNWNQPMCDINWTAASDFCKWLTEKEISEGVLNDGFEYALPTVAQREYACRAGTTTEYSGELDLMAWYEANSGEKTHPVAEKKPNEWGLFDMHGNVWEWCRDQQRDSGIIGEKSILRVISGGGWSSLATDCRSGFSSTTSQSKCSNDVGFRPILQMKRQNTKKSNL